MKIHFLLPMLLCLLLQATPGRAQQRDSFHIAPQATDSVYHRPLFKLPSTVSLLVGTQGVGLEYRVALSTRWNVRLGGAIIPLRGSYDFSLADYKARAKLDFFPANVHLLGEYRPFRRFSMRLVGGLAVFVKNKVQASAEPTGSYTYNNIVLTPERLGDLTVSVKWPGVAPYLGVGFFRALPRRRFNVNLDLGTYYIGKPEGHFVGNGALAGNNQNDAQFNKNIDGYRWLPILQFGFNYKIVR